MMKTSTQELHIAILNTLAYSLHYYESKDERFQEEISLGNGLLENKRRAKKNREEGNEKCLGLDGCCNGKHDTTFEVLSRRFPRGVWWIPCALCWSFTPLCQRFSEVSILICVPYIFQYNLRLLHMMYILSSPFYKNTCLLTHSFCLL